MDVKAYFKKLHELEARIAAEHVIVVSRETADGGRAGVMSEVPKRVACQLALEGRAEFASPEQVEDYRLEQELKRDEYQRALTASRVQVQVVPSEARPNGQGGK
jgi:hypothetical protein